MLISTFKEKKTFWSPSPNNHIRTSKRVGWWDTHNTFDNYLRKPKTKEFQIPRMLFITMSLSIQSKFKLTWVKIWSIKSLTSKIHGLFQHLTLVTLPTDQHKYSRIKGHAIASQSAEYFTHDILLGKVSFIPYLDRRTWTHKISCLEIKLDPNFIMIRYFGLLSVNAKTSTNLRLAHKLSFNQWRLLTTIRWTPYKFPNNALDLVTYSYRNQHGMHQIVRNI